jgi:hypothetical protein
MNRILTDIHIRFVELLLKHEVDFIIIGGYAVIFHGYVRTTGDLDFWLRPDNENKFRLLEAFREFGITPDSLNALAGCDFTQIVAFHHGVVPNKVDFITGMAGLTFDDAIKRVKIFSVSGMDVPVLNLSDLIINKLSTTRLKDKLDVEELQKINQISGKKFTNDK